MILEKFKFDHPNQPLVVKLSDNGIQLGGDDFYILNEWLQWSGQTHSYSKLLYSHAVNEGLLNSYNLFSVSFIDFSNSSISPNCLEQLAFACPNLHQLFAQLCLRDLQGLHAIVYTRKYLQGSNLAKIPVSKVKNSLLLWELLSSLKELTLPLACVFWNHMERVHLISFHSLQALEIVGLYPVEYIINVMDLFSHFPSLIQCRTSRVWFPGFNCQQLKQRMLWK